jgi:hypothetical protein
MVQMSTARQQEQARPMRQRLSHLRARTMARRSGEDGGFTLSPRGKLIVGWLAALLLVIGIAVGVQVLGGRGEGAPIGAGPSGSPIASGSLPAIAFGTEIDPATGQVADDARTDRFIAGDTFAYSVAPSGTVPDPVYVEVRRISGDVEEVAQEAVEGQRLPDPRAIAFTVPADDLLEVFGAGDYVMRIFAEPASEPIAEGAFTLVSTDTPPSASP